MPNVAKYGHLLTDGDVKRWHDNLAAASPITAEVYLRTLGLFCDLEKTTPAQITPRGRVTIAMMAFSGLRPETLGDYLGTDGLGVVVVTGSEVLLRSNRTNCDCFRLGV